MSRLFTTGWCWAEIGASGGVWVLGDWCSEYWKWGVEILWVSLFDLVSRCKGSYQPDCSYRFGILVILGKRGGGKLTYLIFL